MGPKELLSERIATLQKQLEDLKEELAPKVEEAKEAAKPYVEQGLAISKEQFGKAKEKFKDDVLPAAASTLGTAIAVADVLRSQKVAEAVAPVIEPAKKKRGVGKWIALSVGAVAVIGVGIATYRALSVADEHWIGIEDDFPDVNENPLENIANEIADAVNK